MRYRSHNQNTATWLNVQTNKEFGETQIQGKNWETERENA